MMEKSPKTVGNGVHHNGLENGRKNRLRILGTAILERENEPNISASYSYTAGSANEFFEEDINQLDHFQLNKIAVGLTVHKRESSQPSLKDGETSENGLKNGAIANTTALKRFTGETNSEPFLTDIIWSRMDMQNPTPNSDAFIIKQYYSKYGTSRQEEGKRSLVKWHGEKWNTFICGFVSCLAMVLFVGCSLSFCQPSKHFQ